MCVEDPFSQIWSHLIIKATDYSKEVMKPFMKAISKWQAVIIMMLS